MNDKPIRIPGPDHPISVERNPKRIVVTLDGKVIADTTAALTLREAAYPAVHYIPRADVAMDALARSDTQSYCPYKGDASYFSIARDGEIAENAVWTYETPYPAVDRIKDHLAFYPNQVEIQEIDESVSPEVIRDVIEHTDSGSGSSQLDHWPTNVSQPKSLWTDPISASTEKTP